MAKTGRKERSLALYETILKLKDLDECCKFFDDLCTPTELRSLEQRFDVAVYLQQGLVYLDILEKTGASSATISRVRRSMLDNGAGGVMRDVILRDKRDFIWVIFGGNGTKNEVWRGRLNLSLIHIYASKANFDMVPATLARAKATLRSILPRPIWAYTTL